MDFKSRSHGRRVCDGGDGRSPRDDRLKQYSDPTRGPHGKAREQSNLDKWSGRASQLSDGDRHRAHGSMRTNGALDAGLDEPRLHSTAERRTNPLKAKFNDLAREQPGKSRSGVPDTSSAGRRNMQLHDTNAPRGNTVNHLYDTPKRPTVDQLYKMGRRTEADHSEATNHAGGNYLKGVRRI